MRMAEKKKNLRKFSKLALKTFLFLSWQQNWLLNIIKELPGLVGGGMEIDNPSGPLEPKPFCGPMFLLDLEKMDVS